jgi:hypothetical protein
MPFEVDQKNFWWVTNKTFGAQKIRNIAVWTIFLGRLAIARAIDKLLKWN